VSRGDKIQLAPYGGSYVSDYGLSDVGEQHPCAVGYGNMKAALKSGADAALLMEADSWRELVDRPRVVGRDFVKKVFDKRFA
jgi:hypothetical protein